MADRTLKYRDLLRRLKAYGVEECSKRGKGSERLLSRRERQDRQHDNKVP
jgi:hypothetical protein